MSPTPSIFPFLELKERLGRAYLIGEGGAVLSIWRCIAQRKLSTTSALDWARMVAEWICGTPDNVEPEHGGLQKLEKPYAPTGRTERIHAALALTGWAEPRMDRLGDQQLLLICAQSGLKAAAERVWELVATGKATLELREQWLNFVAVRVHGVRKDSDLTAKNRPDAYMRAVCLSGRSHMSPTADDVAIFCTIAAKFPKQLYSKQERKFVSTLLTRMQEIGLLSKDLDKKTRSKWERRIREEMEKNAGPPKPAYNPDDPPLGVY